MKTIHATYVWEDVVRLPNDCMLCKWVVDLYGSRWDSTNDHLPDGQTLFIELPDDFVGKLLPRLAQRAADVSGG